MSTPTLAEWFPGERGKGIVWDVYFGEPELELWRTDADGIPGVYPRLWSIGMDPMLAPPDAYAVYVEPPSSYRFIPLFFHELDDAEVDAVARTIEGLEPALFADRDALAVLTDPWPDDAA